jgi:hypothetical protein
MIASIHQPHQEQPEDMTLTICIQRPSKLIPDGHISMTAERITASGLKNDDAACGKHDQTTMTRILHDVQNYFSCGTKLWVDRINREKRSGPQL